MKESYIAIHQADQKPKLRRCFVGFALAQEENQRIDSVVEPYRENLRRILPKEVSEKLRWTSSQNRHLTWIFLGNLNDQQLQQIETALQQQLSVCSRFNLDFNSLGPFPTATNPVAIAMRTEATEPTLDVWRRVRSACDTVLIPTNSEKNHREKRFDPHVTVARIGNRLQNHPSVSHLAATAIEIPVEINNVTIFLSKLTPTGSHYQHYAQIPLSG